MKEFVVYTALRLALFAATWALTTAAWVLLFGSVSLSATFIVALVISGIGSYFVLSGPRERFARSVEERAHRASAAFEERRAREDNDV